MCCSPRWMERPGVQPDTELVTWWAELFEVPSVGFANDPDQALDLAAAGADFAALGDAFCRRPDASGELTTLARKLGEFTTPEVAAP
jgi:thiamine monophosphate synthase